MYSSHSEIPIKDLLNCAQHDLSRGQVEGKYMLCLRVNSTSIYSTFVPFPPTPATHFLTN